MEGILSILFMIFGIPGLCYLYGILSGRIYREREQKERDDYE